MNSMVHLEPNVNSVITSMVQKLDGLSGMIDFGNFLQLFAFGTAFAIESSLY